MLAILKSWFRKEKDNIIVFQDCKEVINKYDYYIETNTCDIMITLSNN